MLLNSNSSPFRVGSRNRSVNPTHTDADVLCIYTVCDRVGAGACQRSVQRTPPAVREWIGNRVRVLCILLRPFSSVPVHISYPSRSTPRTVCTRRIPLSRGRPRALALRHLGRRRRRPSPWRDSPRRDFPRSERQGRRVSRLRRVHGGREGRVALRGDVDAARRATRPVRWWKGRGRRD